VSLDEELTRNELLEGSTPFAASTSVYC
jgi:hypothetical protein